MQAHTDANNTWCKSDLNGVAGTPLELLMNTIAISAALLTLVGGHVTSPITKFSTSSLSVALSAATLRFPATRTEADSYKLTNPVWKAETLRYLADGIHRAHTSTTGSSTVDLDRFDAMGAAVITSNTAIGQGKVQFSVNLPLRDIQTIRIVQPKHSRNLSIELVTQTGAQSIHVWRKMTSTRTNDTFKASTDRISFVAPETASGARVLAELLADIIRDAGGSPVISSE
jgi:hypothetical protein